MLVMQEVNTEEEYLKLKAAQSPKKDYLYFLKYCNKIIMSDNGTEIPLCCNLLDQDDIEKEIYDIINLLNS